MGIQKKYKEDIENKILSLMSEGITLSEICRDPDMPGIATVIEWRTTREGFSDRYACAREAQLDVMAAEILDISDNSTNDFIERKNADGEVIGLVPNPESTNRSRLRTDNRKWLLSKLRPREYGDRQTIEHDTSESFNDFLNKLKNG